MKIESMRLPGCYKITPEVLSDDRGEFIKTFVEFEYINNNVSINTKEEYFSRSHKGVLRGMHFQIPPFEYIKLVSCLSGQLLDVILDIRVGSPTYGSFESLELNGDKAVSLFLPAGIAHGFLSLTENTVVSYKVSSGYAPTHDCGIRWDSFNVDWRIPNPIISPRDLAFPSFTEFISPFKFTEG